MKKILSFLALLMMTVTAFATDYVGHRTVISGTNSPTESEDAVLKITDNGNNTYNVTFENVINVDGTYTDNYGTFTFSNVAGTTTDGLTTIDLSGLNVSVTNSEIGFTEFSDCVLLAKFNAEKAYAKFSFNFYGSTFSTEFGTDDFSTGGGSGTTDPSEPTIEGTPIADLTNFSAGGNKFEFPMTINWDKQYFKAVIDVTNCVNQSENILSVGEDVSAWKIGGWHFYYSKNHTSYGANALKVDYLTTGGAHPLSTVKNGYTGEITIEISKANGCLVNGEPFLDNYNSSVTGTWQENTANFWTLTNLGVGSKEGGTRSNATIKYATVIDIPDTPVDPKPEFPTPAADAKQYTTDNFVPEAGGYPAGTFSATAYVNNNGGTADIQIDKVNIPDWAVDSKINVAGVTVGTEGEFTTFSGSDLQLMTEAGDVYKADVTGKAKDDKLYLTIYSDDAFGWGGALFTFGDENFPVTPEPVVEYPINFDKDANSTRSDRVLRSVSLTEEGGEAQTISTNSSNKPYQDKTAETLTVKAGSKLAATFDYSGSWMHGYVYVDENNDKQFSYKEGNVDQTGTELKAFSFYSGSFTVESEGYNSNGDYITGDARNVINPPSFTAPTVPGTYRIRFKVDWNSVDPGGQLAADGTATGNNGILKNGGIILDATLVVEEAEEPFAPVVRTAEDVANVTYGGTTTNYDANNVEITEYEQGKFKVTYKDLTVGNNRLGDLTIDNVTSVAGEDGTETLTTTATEGTWSNVSDNQIVLTLIPNETSAISNFAATITPGAEANTIEKLNLAFNVTLGGSEANVVFGEKADIWVPETRTTTAPANITFGGETVNFDEATLEVTEDPEDVFAVTYKNLTINGNEIGDFTIKNVTISTEGNVATLSTTDTEGTWTRVAENNALNVEAGTTVAIRNFEGTSTFDESTETEKVVVKFGLNITGEWADVVFGEKAEPVTPPTPDCEFIDVVDHGFAPAGEAWQKTGVAIDWDTQYIKAEIDLSTCKTSGKENILGIGDDLTGWNNGPHYLFYYDASAKELQYNYLNLDKKDLNGGYANLSKAYLNAEGVVTIELSKKHGLKINGESCLVKYVPTANSVATNGTESWTEDDLENVFGNLWAMSEIGFGGCQGETMSNATYNYIHILDLPVEPETRTFDGQLQISDYTDQTIVKEEEAQVEITDNFDGTGSITFKNVQLGEQTVDLTFVGTFADDEIEVYDETEGSDEFLFTAKSDATTTEVFGKEITFECQGTISDDDADVELTFAMESEDETISYFGQFGKGLWDAISGINADAAAGNAQIFTIGGAKVNSLKKGINIVRTADGKTIKVLRK